MKTKILVLAFLAFITTSYSQGGESLINAQLGFGGNVQTVELNIGAYGSYEYYLSDNISVGGLVGFISVDAPEAGPFAEEEEADSNLVLGGLFNYHFLNGEKFDAYLGSSIGFASAYTGSFLYEFHGGARYFISDNIALNSELGFGLSVLKLGVSFKI